MSEFTSIYLSTLLATNRLGKQYWIWPHHGAIRIKFKKSSRVSYVNYLEFFCVGGGKPNYSRSGG